MPKTERPARVQATPATNPAEPSFRPDNSIRVVNDQCACGPHVRSLFDDAQDYQRAGVRLDRLASNYRELKWPEEGALKECVTLAAIARTPADRSRYLLECARIATVLADREWERA
jgi:hypothetical protein